VSMREKVVKKLLENGCTNIISLYKGRPILTYLMSVVEKKIIIGLYILSTPLAGGLKFLCGLN
jgi:hypothetical protein